MSGSPRITFALVGCGAVAHAHVPILAQSGDAELTLLVDKSLARARELGASYGISNSIEDYREVPGRAQAAIVALPHHLHAPVAIDLLKSGVHVLVEKPMAMTAAECDAMIEAARQGGATLAVGQLRRFFHSSRFIKRVVDSGMLGRIKAFDMREGTVYSWPAASDFTFKPSAGGGVLADQGAHSLDILLWWLGDFDQVEYRDDAFGGVEADAEIRLVLQSGATGVVELSRTRNLRHSVVITGERGTLEVDTQFDSAIAIRLEGEATYLSGRALRDDAPGEDVTDVFRRQLADFVDAIRQRREPLVSGREGRRAVAAMEACRAHRQPLELPWRAVAPAERLASAPTDRSARVPGSTRK
jgi:predicted dehydrogenase